MKVEGEEEMEERKEEGEEEMEEEEEDYKQQWMFRGLLVCLQR